MNRMIEGLETSDPGDALSGRPTLNDERALHDLVLESAASAFRSPRWSLVRNTPERATFGVAPGLYPDLVALDASGESVAWIFEVGTPESVADDDEWQRWRRLAETGLPFVVAVPSECGRMAEDLARMLEFRFGLIYEFALTQDGVRMEPLERPDAARCISEPRGGRVA